MVTRDANPHRGRTCAGNFAAHQPSRARKVALSSAARAQSGRLVSVGRRSVRQSAPRKQTDLSLDRLLDLPLVPRHGARVVRERRDGRDHESRVREHQSRSRRAAGRRSRLHDVCAGDDGRRRLADECLADAEPATVCRWNVFSAGRSIWSAGFQKGSRRNRGGLETESREDCGAGKEDR